MTLRRLTIDAQGGRVALCAAARIFRATSFLMERRRPQSSPLKGSVEAGRLRGEMLAEHVEALHVVDAMSEVKIVAPANVLFEFVD